MRRILSQIAATLLCISTCLAQQNPADEVEWQKIRAIKPIYESTLKGRDLSALKEYFSPNFTGAMLTGEEVKGFDGLQKYYDGIWAMIGEGGSYSTEINYAPGQLHGEVAIAHGTTKDKVVAHGKEFEYSADWSGVFVKEGDAWKVFRIHSSIDPINNPFVRVTRQKEIFICATGSLLLGFLLGLLVFKLRRKV